MQANITVIMTKQAVGGRPPRYASTPCKLTISSYLFARWHLFRHVGYLRHQQQVDLTFWSWKWCSSHVWLGHHFHFFSTLPHTTLCANFSLPRLLCSRLRPDIRDRERERDRCQTDRQTSDKHRLMPPPYGGGDIISENDPQHCRLYI